MVYIFWKLIYSLRLASLTGTANVWLINYDQGNISPSVAIKAAVKEASYTHKIGVREKLYKGPSGVVEE